MRGPAAVRRLIETVELAPDLVIKAEAGPSPFNKPITCPICQQRVRGEQCTRIQAFNVGGVQTKRGYPQIGICISHDDAAVRAKFNSFSDQILEHHLRVQGPTQPTRTHKVRQALPVLDVTETPHTPTPEPICSAVYWSLWWYPASRPRVRDDHRPAQRTLWGVFERPTYVDEPAQLQLQFRLNATPTVFHPELKDLPSSDAAEAIMENYTPSKRREVQIAIVCGYRNLYEGVVRELAKRGEYTSVHINLMGRRQCKPHIPNASAYVILSHAAGSHSITQHVINRAKQLDAGCISTPFKTATVIADQAIMLLSKGTGINLRLLKGGVG